MNLRRRISALKREIGSRRSELERVERLRAAGDRCVTALPEFASKYVADIEAGIAQREEEIRRFETSS